MGTIQFSYFFMICPLGYNQKHNQQSLLPLLYSSLVSLHVSSSNQFNIVTSCLIVGLLSIFGIFTWQKAIFFFLDLISIFFMLDELLEFKLLFRPSTPETKILYAGNMNLSCSAQCLDFIYSEFQEKYSNHVSLCNLEMRKIMCKVP